MSVFPVLQRRLDCIYKSSFADDFDDVIDGHSVYPTASAVSFDPFPRFPQNIAAVNLVV